MSLVLTRTGMDILQFPDPRVICVINNVIFIIQILHDETANVSELICIQGPRLRVPYTESHRIVSTGVF